MKKESSNRRVKSKDRQDVSTLGPSQLSASDGQPVIPSIISRTGCKCCQISMYLLSKYEYTRAKPTLFCSFWSDKKKAEHQNRLARSVLLV